MLDIKVQKDGVAFSDFDLLEEAESIVDKYKRGVISVVCVSTGNIIEALRVMVVRDKLSYDDIRITFGEEVITLNKYAEYSKHISGFLDWDRKFLREIIGKRRNNH